MVQTNTQQYLITPPQPSFWEQLQIKFKMRNQGLCVYLFTFSELSYFSQKSLAITYGVNASAL